MTYLELVNNVLRRMREDEVSTVAENTYSKMVGDFVNDAKNIVEAAWDWSGLRTTLTVTTSADIFNYVLTEAKTVSRRSMLLTIPLMFLWSTVQLHGLMITTSTKTPLAARLSTTRTTELTTTEILK